MLDEGDIKSTYSSVFETFILQKKEREKVQYSTKLPLPVFFRLLVVIDCNVIVFWWIGRNERERRFQTILYLLLKNVVVFILMSEFTVTTFAHSEYIFATVQNLQEHNSINILALLENKFFCQSVKIEKATATDNKHVKCSVSRQNRKISRKYTYQHEWNNCMRNKCNELEWASEWARVRMRKWNLNWC